MNRSNTIPPTLLLVAAASLLTACVTEEGPRPQDDDSTSGETSAADSTGDSMAETSGISSADGSSTDTSGDGSEDSTATSGADSEGSSDDTSGSDSGTSTGDTGSDSGSSTGASTGGEAVCGDGQTQAPEECDDDNDTETDGCLSTCVTARSCAQILAQVPDAADGVYSIDSDDQGAFEVLCDMTTDGGGWTLIARFSNADNVPNWMLNDGSWWFDLETQQGNPLSRTQLFDMLSPAFWRVTAGEFKIGRSDNDDPSHLLQTNAQCLGGDTFRGFITGLGYDNSGPWATDEVLHTCTADLGNNYAETSGFSQAECTGDIGAPNSVSFWANWHDPDNAFAADSAVMMIGGGGQACARADHGIGITEENEANFAVGVEPEGTYERDFADDGFAGPVTDYALNLWVR